MKRADGRQPDEPRRVVITPRYLKHAEGSVLIEVGDTKVICAATVEDKVPPFLKGTGTGWVTAEYSMLPRSSRERIPREAVKGKLSGRTQEIQRLIGRSLRAIMDLPKLGERTVWIDCDVIQADGGTRTASISGAFVALALALRAAKKPGGNAALPIRDHVAATSVGIVNETTLLDLNYEEDSKAEVDMNVVMTGSGELVEVQGTAESRPFAQATLHQMLEVAGGGIRKLIDIQREVLEQS
ncbi:MAG TPA: ribonuclease PH [Vicinamibacteria bacterium]|jgi:ribonuclease PH